MIIYLASARVIKFYRKKSVNMATWSEYIIMAAQHSKGSAAHWFRYLRKDIEKFGVLFTKQEVEDLYNNKALTPFQRVSIKYAFEENSPTRQYIIGLNRKANRNKIALVRAKYENTSGK